MLRPYVSVSVMCVCVWGVSVCAASAYVRSCDPAFTCVCQSVCMHACVRACVRACARAERAASVSVYARVTVCVRAHACGILAAFRRLRINLKHTNRLN